MNEISAEVGAGWPGLDTAGEGGLAGQWGTYKVGYIFSIDFTFPPVVPTFPVFFSSLGLCMVVRKQMVFTFLWI